MTIYKLKTDPFSSHSKIISILKKEKKSLNILDVGCADGFLDKILIKYGHKVYGIEKNKEDILSAKKWCQEVMICNLDNINELKFNFKKDFFDIIIFSSVLEHLKSPSDVITKLLLFLKDKGKIIIAISNIANIYIRFNLLFGRFNYSKKGLLDETHIKFFTLKTAKKLIESANLKINKLDVTPVPLPLIFSSTSKGKLFNFVHQINYFLAKLFKTLFGYIFIIEAKKIKSKNK